MLGGWGAYFRYGNSSQKFSAIDSYVHLRMAEDMHDAALDLDDEEPVVAPEHDAVDAEEVHGHDALSLGSQELRPGRTLTSRSGWKAVTAEHRGHVRLRHDDAELLEFADDPEIAERGFSPRNSRGGRPGGLRLWRSAW